MKLTSALVEVMAAILFFGAACSGAHAGSRACPQKGDDEQTAKFRNYTFRTIRTEDKGCIEVRKDNKVVYSESEEDVSSYVIGNNLWEAAGNSVIKPGTDITGSGRPQLLFASWSGGAHCCFTFRVLELGERPHIIATLDAGDSDGAHFADLKGDGRYEFVANDWTFAYWHASFAASPAPALILSWQDDSRAFKIDLELMRKPSPSPAAFEELVAKIKKEDDWQGRVPPDLWRAMLDFIYTGHPDLAWKIHDLAWPSSKPGKGGFLGAFCEQLQQSPYFDDLADSLKNHPPDCFMSN